MPAAMPQVDPGRGAVEMPDQNVGVPPPPVSRNVRRRLDYEMPGDPEVRPEPRTAMNLRDVVPDGEDTNDPFSDQVENDEASGVPERVLVDPENTDGKVDL